MFKALLQRILDPPLYPEAFKHYLIKGSVVRLGAAYPWIRRQPAPRAVAAIPSFTAEQKCIAMHCSIQCTLATRDFLVPMR